PRGGAARRFRPDRGRAQHAPRPGDGLPAVLLPQRLPGAALGAGPPGGAERAGEANGALGAGALPVPRALLAAEAGPGQDRPLARLGLPAAVPAGPPGDPRRPTEPLVGADVVLSPIRPEARRPEVAEAAAACTPHWVPRGRPRPGRVA